MKTIRLHHTAAQAAAAAADLTVEDMPDPGQPGKGEIRVRIHASSLNFHDYAVIKGWLPTASGRIPLSDAGGVVEAVGEGVSDFRQGDAVVSCFSPFWQNGGTDIEGFGQTPGDGLDGYARQFVVRPAQWFTHAPQQYSHAEAATITTAGLTAWRSLVVEGALKAGDSVLVMGTGGVSIFALQIAKAMGARVIATSSSDEKLQRLLALGADEVINYKKNADWGMRVRALTNGVGVDHVVEVGGPATIDQSTLACRIGGHLSLIGVLTGFSGEVPFGRVLQRQLRIHGITVGSRQHQIDFVKALNASGIRPVIDSHWPLEKLSEAFRHEESGAHFGKICINI